MSEFMDYYEILQVHPSAEPEVIKGAYDKLAKKYHPDLNKDPTATERMKQINLAYEVLSNPQKRRQFDLEWRQRRGNAGPRETRDEPTAPRPSAPATPQRELKRWRKTVVAMGFAATAVLAIWGLVALNKGPTTSAPPTSPPTPAKVSTQISPQMAAVTAIPTPTVTQAPVSTSILEPTTPSVPTATPKQTASPTTVLTPTLLSKATPLPWNDDFETGTLDTSHWHILPLRGYNNKQPEVVVANDRLEMAISSPQLTGGGVYTMVPAGDFDARVEYGFINWHNQNVEKLGIVIVQLPPGNSANASVERIYWNGDQYAVNIPGAMRLISTAHSKGSLRMVRQGTTMTGYYLGPSGWVELGSGKFTSSEVELGLYVWNDPGLLGTPKIYFDNFQLGKP